MQHEIEVLQDKQEETFEKLNKLEKALLFEIQSLTQLAYKVAELTQHVNEQMENLERVQDNMMEKLFYCTINSSKHEKQQG